jgi:hypothetical protein
VGLGHFDDAQQLFCGPGVDGAGDDGGDGEIRQEHHRERDRRLQIRWAVDDDQVVVLKMILDGLANFVACFGKVDDRRWKGTRLR